MISKQYFSVLSNHLTKSLMYGLSTSYGAIHSFILGTDFQLYKEVADQFFWKTTLMKSAKASSIHYKCRCEYTYKVLRDLCLPDRQPDNRKSYDDILCAPYNIIFAKANGKCPTVQVLQQYKRCKLNNRKLHSEIACVSGTLQRTTLGIPS